ncbi:phytanoyl-CoA dioxygenase family protein [Marinoscillum furvescens]|uniref:Phytanoyl-CoA dioxygenase PhyH n=1 Tax=Marinoscillum furvescens DSM 4134 TaxID=1122208 RepID=A0A3D9KZG8_MARFU|nr:phytanoyl-CoA dioxygenase family protein [Marinoscillum furvescens]RED92308.1 phytanoyl-CoA dioxygenase PhyH [Marinoscillum furvescens DSM 4134]
MVEMIQSTLKDPTQREQFNRDGFLIIDYFEKQEIAEMRDYFFEHVSNYHKEALYESSRNNSNETNDLINGHLKTYFERHSDKFFENYKLYGGTYMVKPERSENFLPLHQDWSIVEEDKYETLFLWCPLQDTSKTNGGLFVVPGSHHFFQNRRSGSLPAPRIETTTKNRRFTKNLEVKAGQVVLYSDQLFHGSYPNSSQQPRIVATARVMNSEAKLTYYHKLSEEETAVYFFSKDNYLNGILKLVSGDIPDGLQPAYIEQNNNQPITESSFDDKLPAQSSWTALLHRLNRLFKS